MATVNPEEQDVALSIANHPATRLPGPSLLHHLVQHRSETKDKNDALAIDYLAPDGSRVSLSYHELHQKSDALAARISFIAGPVTDDDNTQLIVPVLIPQCPELYISQLAILKAGGAFCPLNLDIPLERAKFILNEVSAAMVITTPELAERVPETETGKKLLILTDEVFSSSTDTRVEHRQPTADNIAYIMYTSGSTGTPKGVPITHDAATQSLLAHDRHIPPFSRFLQFAAPTFDVSVFEIFFPLFRGKTLVSCDRSAMLNDLPGIINELDIDACELTPSVAGSLLRKRSNAPGLKLLLTIGEMLTQPVVQEFGGDDTKESILWGMYGPTEAAIHCTIQPSFSTNSIPGLIGFPFDTVSCFILAIPSPSSSSTSNPAEIKILPLGETGELAIGGHQLAPHYLNRPSTTALAFVHHPTYGLLYRTKDKARMLPDGTMQCLGRIEDDDGQVKLRGQRIELGEIEHAALRAGGCHSAVAAVVKSILVLFCAVDAGEDEDEMSTKIEQSCKAWLPGFMIPNDIVVMKEFPRLPSGKVDRKGLVRGYEEAMLRGGTSSGGGGGGGGGGQMKEEEEGLFGDEKERQIYVLVRDVLGVVVRPTQNLMQAGMDSLSAIKLASKMRKGMGVVVGANEILGARTIRALREVVRGLEEVGGGDGGGEGGVVRTYEPVEVVAGNEVLRGRLESIEAVMPCTPLQTAMLSETTGNPRAYCNWLRLKFPEGCMEADIRSWFLQLAQSNEALRTGFVHHDGQFLQIVFKSLDESLISLVDNITEEFSFLSDEDFLHPFRIFITPSSATSPTTVEVLLQIHHAIYDGWSTSLLLSDLHSLINKGNSPPPSRPPFSTITTYYHSPSYHRACNSAREFWAQHLASFQPSSLPELQPAITPSSTVVHSHTIHLPPTLSPQHIKSTLRSSGIDCTPQVLFQSALAWLWSVYMGSQDVVIGTVTSGRTIPVPGIEEIFGPCIATVPLRTDLASVRTVRDLLGSVQAVGREVVRHGVLPLKEVKRVAGVRTGQSLFGVLFVYQETLDVLSQTGGKGGRGEKRVEVEQGRDWLETKLLVEAEPRQEEEGYDLALTYHGDAFTEKQVKVLGEQLGVLVEGMLDNLDKEVSELRGVFPKKLLSSYNEKPKTLDGVPDLARAVEAAVERNPGQEALCFAERIGEDGSVEAERVSYAELNGMANRIAWLLHSRGVKEGDIVAIVMEKSVLLFEGILAILKAGCAYLPLLPSLPVERVKTVFGQAGVRFCLTDTESKMKLEEIPGVEFVDIQTTDLTTQSDLNLNLPTSPSRLAYIIYTSGSTGLPKGVCVTHLNITSNLAVLSHIYHSRPGTSRLLQSCSQAFDVSVFEIFFAWTQSLTLCSGTNDVLFSDLEHSIRSLKITHLSMTPTVASLVSPENVPHVEFLVTAGEPMTPAVASKWHKQLWQGYGPSETTNICSVKRMVIPPLHRIRHLGFVFPNTSAFVVYPDTDTIAGSGRDKLELVPLGGFGELCFGGDQVVKGYLGQDELTREKFVEHEEWGRVYRSGDLGRMLADGSLVIWGRVDEQVKVRGQRVELGEVDGVVEAAAKVVEKGGKGGKVSEEGKLKEGDEVECATLFFKTNEGAASTIAGQGQIVSFFVPSYQSHDPANFTILDLDDTLKSKIRSIFHSVEARVPSYMIPSFIIPISKLPITASGKLDRRLLETSFTSLTQDYLTSVSPSIASSSIDDDDSGEWSETEIKVAEIVCRVFAVERGSVQRWTPLTAFGLDSISAIELSKQLAMELGGKRLAISTVLRNATVARVAGALEQERSAGSLKVVPVGDKVDGDVVERDLEPLLPGELVKAVMSQFEQKGKKVEKVLPCTPLQEGMLAASVGRGRGAYVNKMLLKLSTTIDVEGLRQAWAKACERQGILRTAFVSTEDPERPMIQVVLEAGSWEVPWLESHASSTDDLDKIIDEHVSTLSEPVDSFEPPISLQLNDAGDEKYLSFICHHALYDGVAIQRLLYEVAQLLTGQTLQPAPPYEPFLRESLALAKAPETEKFWRDQLTGLHPRLLTRSFNFPPSNPSISQLEAAPTLLTTPLPTSLSQITSRTKFNNVSLLSLVQASWATVLSILLRSEDVCFGNVLSGRTLAIERIDGLVAPCFNTVPVRMKMGELAGDRNLDLVRAFGELGAKVLEGRGFVGLRRVQSFLKEGERRVFDTLVLLQQAQGGGWKKGDGEDGEKVWEVVRDEGGMDVPVVVEFVPDARRDELVVNLHLEGGHFPQEFANLILDLLFTTLDNFLQYPASHVWRYDTLPAPLKEKLSQLPFDDSQVSVSSSPAHAQTNDGDEEWSNLESRIRNVLASLMSHKDRRIGRQTTIYQLGLDSISAVQIASMLRKELGSEGIKVNASDVIAYPSCAGLAGSLESQKRTSQVSDTEPKTVTYDVGKFRQEVQGQIKAQLASQDVNRTNVEQVLPCTPLQSGMWMQFLSSAQNGGRDYLNFLEYRVDASSGVGLEGLQGAWKMLFQAQPILRTGLVAVEHNDSAFAMVQYHPGAIQEPVSVVKGQSFDLNKWRGDLANSIVNGKQPVPWGVMLVENDDGLAMHVGMHHVLYDAQSLQVLMKELAKAVSGETLTPSSTTETEAAVSDILTQIDVSRETAEKFWKAQADKTVINSFPVMTPLKESSRNIQVETLQGGMSLPVLEKAAAESGYSLQVLIQASWARILSAYLGESSVTFGMVLSGRNTDATRDAVFPCITTLPVIAANVAAGNGELLQGMMKYNAELYKQQHQPLAKIQQWLGRQETRLFDTLVVYQKFSSGGDETQKEAPWILVEDAAMIDYPVSIEVEPLPTGEMKYGVTFFDDVLPREQAQLLLKQFQAMVEYLALHPSGDGDGLLELRPELFAILPPQQDTLPVPDEIKFLHQFVEVQALKTPDKTALFFADRFDSLGKPVGREWSYKELDANGNRVANMLAGHHVKVGDIVAVYFDKCPEAFFAILGVLKAGASFVALDPGAPEARKEFIVRDSGATALLTTAGKAESMEFAVEIPVLGVGLASLKEFSADPPVLDRDILPSDAAYCLYTSGTTGTPKGCEITHDNTVQCMLAFQHIFTGHWEPNSRWLQFASLHFDVSVLEQYWSWSVGITLVGAPKDLILEDLAGTISRLEITHIDLTPSLARLLHPDDVPSLCRGVFITGGESLKQEILDVWGDKAVIYNFYGPTEATIGVTVYPRVPRNGRASNIGRQFINVGSYVLKPGTDRPVLRGAVGELCVSGKLVGKGYLGREDLTKERFPTLMVQGREERVYRTGDLVRVLHDDCFDFLGRADDQVKLRGQRLEIGEINHSIKTGVAKVQDVATVVIRNEKAGKDFLVSFVTTAVRTRSLVEQSKLEVIRDGGNDTANLVHKVRQACRAKLPGYMVPTYVMRLPYIPLSANNKAEIKELKRLFGSLSQEELVGLSPAASSGVSGSLTPTGQRVAQVLSEMLSIDVNVVTPSTSIFELGLDSISALRFSRALKRSGFPQASPSLILSHPLIADLAQALDSGKTQSNTAQVAAAKQLVQACQHRHMALICKELGVSSSRVEYIAPCTGLQAGMIARREKYYNTFRFRTPSGWDLTSLGSAWDKVIEAYPILRTKFVQTTEGFVQVALKPVNAEKDDLAEKEPYHHWRNEVKMKELWNGDQDGDYQPNVKMEDRIAKTKQQWLRDNAEGTITRTVELQLFNIPAPESNLKERILVLHIFHGVYDANSLEMVLSKVQELCRPNGGHKHNPVKGDKEPEFLDALYHGPLQNFAHSKQFWVDHLQNATPQPTFAVPEEASTKAITSQRTIPFSLQSLTKKLGVTTHSLLQAAWVTTLARQFNVRSPTIGVIVSGRAIELDGGASAEHVIGPLFNTLPFHAASVGGGERFRELVKQCHEWNAKVVEWQHVPLRDIQKWCGRVGRGVFEVLFSFQQQSSASGENGGDGMKKGEAVWEVMEEEGDTQADYPLALEATLTRDGEVRLLVVAQEAAVGKEVVEGLMEGLVKVLGEMGEDVDGVVVDGDEVDEAERKTSGREDVKTKTTTEGIERREFVWTEATRMVQEQIATLAEVDVETVTATTSILELGLDSIDTIKLSARLRQLGVKIKPSELMKAQTIEGLVPYLEKQNLANGDQQVKKDSSELWKTLADKIREELGEDVEAVLPATPLQDGMVAEMIHSDFQLYFNHDIMEVQPHVDLAKLKAAWQTVIANSPILRTSFITVDDPSLDFAYFQVIHRQLPDDSITEIEIETEDDLSKITTTATARALQAGGSSNLLQLTFATLNERRFVTLSIAHALYDGWSLSLLHRDVQAAYDNRYTPRPSYTSYLAEIIRSGDDRSSSFWSGYLAGAKPTFYPQLPSPDAGQIPVIHRHETLSSINFARIKSFTKQHAITLQTLGQACHAAVLASLTKTLDIIFGVVLSGRSGSEEAEQLLFPTMNTVAVRSMLHGDVAGWLRYMQSVSNDIGGREHFPLRKVQRMVEGGGGGGQGQLFNTLFIMQRGVNSQGMEGDGREEVLVRSVGGSSAVEYPVCVEMEVVKVDGGEEKLVWRTACDSRFVDGQQGAEGLLERLDIVLRFLVESTDGEKSVLEFEEGKMRVCGLEGFKPVGDDDGATSNNSDGEVREDAEDSTWSETEEKIRAVLAKVAGLEVSAVQKGNNIYHLGLDSISAIKVVSLLRKQGVVIPLRQLLKARNISEMAHAVIVAEEKPAAVSTESTTPNDMANGTNAIDETALTQQGIDTKHITTLLNQASILSSSTEPITDKIEATLPATAMQVHMLSVWQNTHGDVFHATFTYRLTGNVSKSVLSAAWKLLVAEFPILRTIFLANDRPDTPVVQVVLKPDALNHSTEDDSDPKQWSSLSTKEDKSPGQPFNSISGQLSDNGDWILSFKIHHALYDAISLPMLVNRFAALCSGASSIAKEDTSKSLEIWKEYSIQRTAPDAKEKAKKFWREYLAGAVSTPLADLPVQATLHPQEVNPGSVETEEEQQQSQSTWLPPFLQPFIEGLSRLLSRTIWPLTPSADPTHQSPRISHVQHHAIPDIARIKKLCSAAGVSIQALFFAAYALFLSQSSSSIPEAKYDEVVFGIYLANRSSELAELPYPTLCLVPLRVKVKGNGSLLDMAKRIQEDLYKISAPENDGVGLWEIKQWTGVEVDGFVNFLSVPSNAESNKADGEGQEEVVRVELVSEGEVKAMDGQDGGKRREFVVPMELEMNAVRDAYPDAIDVEVAVEGDAVTVGVFGSREKMGPNGPRYVVTKMVEALTAV